MNKVILIGNLTADPELATTSSGVSVCRFSIAVKRPFENTNGERETDFFNIKAWRTIAETCNKFLKKGSKCAVIGSLQNRSYETNDGTKRTVTEVVAEGVEFLTPSTGSQPAKVTQPDLTPVDDDDSLPF